jgi:hypothetical protein
MDTYATLFYSFDGIRQVGNKCEKAWQNCNLFDVRSSG